jgi:hypothetical protein
MGILAVKARLEAGAANPEPLAGEAPLAPLERVPRRVVLVKERGAGLVLPDQMQG